VISAICSWPSFAQAPVGVDFAPPKTFHKQSYTSLGYDGLNFLEMKF
jgi:hypothetical protein